MTFGIPFSINFPDRLNLVICNWYNAKTSCVTFRASYFSIKNRSTNHVFSKPFLGPPFSHFLLNCFKKIVLGTPSESDECQNCAQNRPMGANRHKKSISGSSLLRSLFSRNHSNYCAVGTSWLLKAHYVNGDLLIGCFFCFSLCHVFYTICFIIVFIKHR